jgi:hypothetical protein
MTEEEQLERALIEPPSRLIDDIITRVAQSSVALAGSFGSGEQRDLKFMGSATLVTIVGAHYILTACHVWEKLAQASHIGITTGKEIETERFFIPNDGKEIIPFVTRRLMRRHIQSLRGSRARSA